MNKRICCTILLAYFIVAISSAAAPVPSALAASWEIKEDPTGDQPAEGDQTDVDWQNLYCEYAFCIEHSPGLHYYDPAVERIDTNSVEAGFLLSCCSVQTDAYLMWHAIDKNLWNPLSDIERIIGFGLDTLSDPEVTSIGDYEVTYQLVVDPNANAEQGWPYGILGTWHCGSRCFLLSLMFEEDIDALAQIEKYIGSFRCSD